MTHIYIYVYKTPSVREFLTATSEGHMCLTRRVSPRIQKVRDICPPDMFLNTWRNRSPYVPHSSLSDTLFGTTVCLTCHSPTLSSAHQCPSLVALHQCAYIYLFLRARHALNICMCPSLVDLSQCTLFSTLAGSLCSICSPYCSINSPMVAGSIDVGVYPMAFEEELVRQMHLVAPCMD